MTAAEQGPTANGLVERVKNILFTPAETWDRIDVEPATIKGLYVGYVCILAAIGPVAQLIGSELFGYHFLFISFRPSFGAAISQAVVSYLLSLAGVYVSALVIDGLAPSFGGTRNRIQAFKVAAYSWTASWVAQIFLLLPPVSALSIIGIYSLYLLYLGLPKLMKAPQDKALGYTAVAIILSVVIYVVIAVVGGSIARIGMGPGGLA